MDHPIISLLQDFEKPPQLIRIEKRLPKKVGEEFITPVKRVIHEEDEGGMTLRFVELTEEGGDKPSDEENARRNPKIPTIQPSPSA